MKRIQLKVIMAIVLAIIIVSAIVIFTSGQTKVSFNTATISEGILKTTVMATGYVQPVEVVEVGTQVSGVIEKIYVDYNSHVKKGQLLAQLETNTLMEKVNQGKASVRAAQSDLSYAKQNYDRVKTLYEANASTRASYEDVTNRLNQAETAFENSKTTLKQAELNFSYAFIYSPIDGVILDRAVNTGQTVAAAFSTPTLFTIAEDLTKMQVEADVDEADIGQVNVGQQVLFTVDAYPSDTFIGTVSQLRLQPVVKSNVVTYTVVVNSPNPDAKLLPGMTANISIIIASERGLLVPVEAINFELDTSIKTNMNIFMTKTETNQCVWIKTENNIERRQISTGLSDGIFFIIKSGISEGQEVILSVSTGEKQVIKKNTSFLPPPPKGGHSGSSNGGV